MATYTTKSGDMWDAIATEQLGGAQYTDRLMKLNMKHKDIYIFPAGVVLELPVIAKPVNSSLPPWKK